MWRTKQGLATPCTCPVISVKRVGPSSRGKGTEALAVDPAHPESDLFQARDGEPLPGFERLNEIRRLVQRLERARVEPCDAAPKTFDVECAGVEVDATFFIKLSLGVMTRVAGDEPAPRVLLTVGIGLGF